MGVTLIDLERDDHVFDINFWHWPAIVEPVRACAVLPDERVDPLHEPFVGGLTEAEARAVAAGLRERMLPTLAASERVRLDGSRTLEPDDGTFHREPAEQHRNYSTNREVLEEFAAF